jgi:hypothetical protein
MRIVLKLLAGIALLWTVQVQAGQYCVMDDQYWYSGWPARCFTTYAEAESFLYTTSKSDWDESTRLS